MTWNADHCPQPCYKTIVPGPAAKAAPYSELSTLPSVSYWFRVCFLIDGGVILVCMKAFQALFLGLLKACYFHKSFPKSKKKEPNQSTSLPLVCNIKTEIQMRLVFKAFCSSDPGEVNFSSPDIFPRLLGTASQ